MLELVDWDQRLRSFNPSLSPRTIDSTGAPAATLFLRLLLSCGTGSLSRPTLKAIRSPPGGLCDAEGRTECRASVLVEVREAVRLIVTTEDEEMDAGREEEEKRCLCAAAVAVFGGAAAAAAGG